MTREEILQRAIAMANERLDTGDEPPWQYYRLWQLREAAESLLQGQLTPLAPEDLPKPDARPETESQPQGVVVQLHTARRPE